jgi:hypothetical protein
MLLNLSMLSVITHVISNYPCIVLVNTKSRKMPTYIQILSKFLNTTIRYLLTSGLGILKLPFSLAW